MAEYTIAQIRAWKPQGMSVASEAVGRSATKVEDQTQAFRSYSGKVHEDWTGSASANSADYSHQVARTGFELSDRVDDAAKALRRGGHDVLDAQQHVLNTVASARSAGMDVIEESNTVFASTALSAQTAAKPLSMVPGGAAITAAQLAQKVEYWQSQIDHAVENAAAAVRSAASLLASIEVPPALERNSAAAVDEISSAAPAMSAMLQREQITEEVDQSADLSDQVAEEALRLGYTSLSGVGRKHLAKWVNEHKDIVQDLLIHGHEINLPPVGSGYNFGFTVPTSANSKIVYTILIYGGAGIASLKLSGLASGHPSMSGSVQSDQASTEINDDGWSVSATTSEGKSVGVSAEPDGLWLTATNSEDVTHGNISETFGIRPDAPGGEPDPGASPLQALQYDTSPIGHRLAPAGHAVQGAFDQASKQPPLIRYTEYGLLSAAVAAGAILAVG